MDGGAWKAAVHGVTEGRTGLSNFTFTFQFHALKEMATHSSVLAWRIPGMGEHGGLPSMGSHRVGHDWSDFAAAAAALIKVGTGSKLLFFKIGIIAGVLKLQYFGHLMQRTDSFEKTLMLGKIEGGRRRGWQRMRWLNGITDSMDTSLSWWWTGKPGVLQSMGSQRVRHDWANEMSWADSAKSTLWSLNTWL